ncbi:MAG TPA: demethoxyubiquinone hydroxylase family protein, partial [Fusobacteria bacterium]|nr:demethoxyubiquinone hydroxylase family protein [Fusobacteriota bacterium]
QAAFTEDEKTKKQLLAMCSEEREHLKICHGRLDELGAKGSIFNGLWYISSFSLGALAGLTQKRY